MNYTRSSLALVALAALVALGACADAAEPPSAQTGEEDELAAAKPLGPSPKGAGTRYPIVLVHGFTGSRKLWSFVDVPEALRSDGHGEGPDAFRVYHAELPPFGRPDDNGKELARQVDEVLAETGADKVNLIAHSKGGLDARALISAHGYGDRVASLVTVASPHRGTRVADVALGLIDATSSDGVIDDLLSVWTLSLSREEFKGREDILGALEDMSESGSEAWNKAHPDDERVYYQSWAGVSNVGGLPHPFGAGHEWESCQRKGYLRANGVDVPRDRMDLKLVPIASVVAHGLDLEPNDGMATVKSSIWGDFQGCIPADHQDDVGRSGVKGFDSRSGFDHVRFYRQVAFDLAARGF